MVQQAQKEVQISWKHLRGPKAPPRWSETLVRHRVEKRISISPIYHIRLYNDWKSFLLVVLLKLNISN